jgi:hypothetical protein
MKSTALTALCLTVASGANAQFMPIDDLTSCKRVEDSLARLTCYDDLAGRVAVSDTQDESTPEENDETVEEASREDDSPLATAWTLLESADSISGNDISRAYLDSDSRRGGNAAPEFFMLSCDGDGGVSIYMGTTGYIGNMRSRTSVEYRWGDNDPVSERWEGSTNGKAAFLPDGYRDFRSGLESGGELAFRWFDYNGSQSSAIWNKIQLDDNAMFVLSGCGE